MSSGEVSYFKMPKPINNIQEVVVVYYDGRPEEVVGTIEYHQDLVFPYVAYHKASALVQKCVDMGTAVLFASYGLQGEPK